MTTRQLTGSAIAETSARHLGLTVALHPHTEVPVKKRIYTTLFVMSAMAVLAAQPALAGTVYMG